MRALLVANPNATTTTTRTRDVLARALRSEVDLVIEETRRRGHAAELAHRAAMERFDVVVTLGGDGTVNEVVNGLLRDGPSESTPALAVVPGGSTNVFARAVGLPNEVFDATGAILEGIREGRRRTIGLGRAGNRWFTFCAGFGIDAEVVRRVERARTQGRNASSRFYIRATVEQLLEDTDRSAQRLTLIRPGDAPRHGLAMAIVQNTAPWTYFGDRPVNPCPYASFDAGLDLFAMRRLRLTSTLRAARQFFSKRADPHGKEILLLHDQDGFILSSEGPLALQVDGDYVGEREEIEFSSVPDALRVVV